jgi:hypothetical protein
VFAGAIFVRLIFDKVPAGSISPELSWFSPFGVEYSALITAMLLAVFIYGGWESAVNLSEGAILGSTPHKLLQVSDPPCWSSRCAKAEPIAALCAL